MTTDNRVKPFLRWAGGKNWLIKHINELFPLEYFNNYHEPFLGGASIFFSLKIEKKSFLSDLNQDLVETYISLRDDPRSIIKELKSYKNTEEFYYSLRAKNNLVDPIKKAARFIYLNQTSFNGIYRVNLKGDYNVPFGNRKKNFLQTEELISASVKLHNAILFSGDFDLIRNNIKKNDLIFLDPPYTVSHNDNGFIKYNQKLFSLDDQERLSSLVDFIKEKDSFYILTNAANRKIAKIFDKGDRLLTLSRASLIGGMNANRGQTSEYIFTNIKEKQ